jgi:hypothetical protein
MTLNEIRNHPHFPFRSFRNDDLEFLLLEQYWVELFREIVGQACGGAWTPLFPADREEGNPMLHLVDRSASPPRMLRIIQRFNTASLPELDLDTFEEVTFEDDAYVPFVPGLTNNAISPETLGSAEELVLSSDVTPACERMLRQFIGAWCSERVPVSVMESMISEFWGKVKPRLARIERGAGRG